MRAIVMLLLPLFSLTFASFAGYAISSNVTNPFGGGWIELDGAEGVKAIEITVIKQDSRWNYPYDYYPVINEDQNLSGTFKGSEALANGMVDISISKFNASEFLKAPKLDVSENSPEADSSFNLNSTGSGRFSLPGLPCGMYALYATDANTSAILSALPLLITEGRIEMATQSNISAGDVLEINVSMPEEMAENPTYAAVVVSRNDYESAKLIINSSRNASSGSNNSSINLTGSNMMVSVGNNTAEMPPSLSSDSIVDLFPIIPENSAVSLSESVDSKARFYLMTDSTWDGGEYILTCLAYTHDEGIVGMEQKTVEVKS